MAFGFNNCYKDKLDKIESQTSSSKMTQTNPSPNIRSTLYPPPYTPIQRSTPNINPSPNPEADQSLIDAVMEGNINKVREALENGAYVDYIYDKGRTILMLASENNYIDIVRLLLEAGANVNHQGRYGWTALIFAVSPGNFNTGIVKLLLAAGANVNLQTVEDGLTALISASYEGHTEIVKLLLAAGADVNLQTTTKTTDRGWHGPGMTALMYASRTGRTEIVRLLLEAGANINHQSKTGYTALIDASGLGYIETVRLLLEAGANVNHRGKNGRTPLAWARSLGYTEIVKVLQEAGAR